MAKARKPRELTVRGHDAAHIHEAFDYAVFVVARSFTAAEARRLAAWLIRAAEWIENKGTR